jgi:hypothetical protein
MFSINISYYFIFIVILSTVLLLWDLYKPSVVGEQYYTYPILNSSYLANLLQLQSNIQLSATRVSNRIMSAGERSHLPRLI